MKILGTERHGIMMPNKIQPREESRGGGMDGVLYILAAFNRSDDDERNVNVNRNDNDWNDNWWFAGLRNSLRFSPASVYFLKTEAGEFCFLSWPYHPPSILPISRRGVEIATYLFLSKASISHAICRKIFRVSSLTIDLRM